MLAGFGICHELCLLVYFHRAFAAIVAIADRFQGLKLAALACPPAVDNIEAECLILISCVG